MEDNYAIVIVKIALKSQIFLRAWKTYQTYQTIDENVPQKPKPDDCVFLRAWKTYQTELSAGADGRPDFLERKTCNWITETFQVSNICRSPNLIKLLITNIDHNIFVQTCHDKMVATRCKTHSDLNTMVKHLICNGETLNIQW